MFKYGLYRFLALVVRVAYLVALYSGVYLMFSRAGVTERGGMGEAFTVTIAAAVLLHEFLQQSAFISLFRTFLRNQRNNDLRHQVLFHGGVMLVLTLFDAYCVVQLSPVALVLPALFFVSSLLVEADEDAGGLLARQAHAMLMQTTRVTVRQWRARMKRARKLAINLAPVGAALMKDAGNEADATRITTIDTALTAAERTHSIPMQRGWAYNLLHRGQTTPQSAPTTRPPTGGGTPTAAPQNGAYVPPDAARVVESWPASWPLYSGVPLPPDTGPSASPDNLPVRTRGAPGWASAPTLPSTATISPVRTPDAPSRAEAARTAAAALRERRITLIMEWFRAADARGKARPSVRVIVSRIRRAESDRKRNPISESTAGALMRQASDRLTWETAREEAPAERPAQVAQ